MKKCRNEKGQLTSSIEAIKKETFVEAENYYQLGGSYFNNADDTEYVYIENDGVLSHFKSSDNCHLFIPVSSLGTFLPDIATEGKELIKC